MQTIDLKHLILQAGSEELTRDAFDRLLATIYAERKGVDELRQLLTDWDQVASGLSSKTVAGVLCGFGHLALGEFEQAEEVLKTHRRSEWGCFYLAHAALARNRPEEALKIVEEALSKFSDHLPLRYLQVEVLVRQRREEEAEKYLSSLEKVDSDSADFSFHRGLCEERTGNYRRAIDLYREAVRRDSGYERAYFRVGYLLDLYGSEAEDCNDESVAAYESCLRITPVHTNAAINLGLLYEDRERYHDAVKCFETVLKYYPNHPRAKLYLVDALASTSMFYDREQEKKADRQSQVLKIPVSDFELSVRSRNCLQKMNIQTLGDLIMKTEQELLSYKNFGETSLQEIKEMLRQKGLKLGQGLETRTGEGAAGRNPLEATANPDVLDRRIDDLNLSVRSRRCMERLGVTSVRELINKTEVELMSAKNFGMTSLNEIKRKLSEMGLGLRG
jgi:DNA-directed RNA polymerase subunit alpha